jgi:hypothetical protein
MSGKVERFNLEAKKIKGIEKRAKKLNRTDFAINIAAVLRHFQKALI